MKTPSRNRQGRLLMWQVMTHRLKDGFTIAQVAKAAAVDYTTAHKYVQGLKAHDYVVCLRPWIPTEPEADAVYQVALNTGPHPPVPQVAGVLDPNRPGQRMDGMNRVWVVMRMAKCFDVGHLVGMTGLRRETVQTYLGRFVTAGYVEVVRPRDSGRSDGGGMYELVKDTGPLAPVFKRGGEVFDPNLGAKAQRSKGCGQAS